MTITDPEPASKHEEQRPADGGFEAWLYVAAAWLLFIASWGPPLAFGAFESFYLQDLLQGQSEFTISWIGSVKTFLLIAAAVVAGPLFDRGYIKQLMTVGAFLKVFGSFML